MIRVWEPRLGVQYLLSKEERMKKHVKKLELAKETVKTLGVNDCHQVAAGMSESWCYFCLPTPSKFCLE
jgi:hypothetical protein